MLNRKETRLLVENWRKINSNENLIESEEVINEINLKDLGLAAGILAASWGAGGGITSAAAEEIASTATPEQVEAGKEMLQQLAQKLGTKQGAGDEAAIKNIAKYFVDSAEKPSLDWEASEELEKEWRAKAKVLLRGLDTGDASTFAASLFSILSHGLFAGERLNPDRIEKMLVLFDDDHREIAKQILEEAMRYQASNSASNSGDLF
jgi:hypothetical protein